MCGHATIGAAVTLAHLGRIGLGAHRFETPVAVVRVELSEKNHATFENVESHRHLRAVSVKVDGLGRVAKATSAGAGTGFSLTDDAPCPLLVENIPALSQAARAVWLALERHGVTGVGGAEIDHIEFFGPARVIPRGQPQFRALPGRRLLIVRPAGREPAPSSLAFAADQKLPPGDLCLSGKRDQEPLSGQLQARRERRRSFRALEGGRSCCEPVRASPGTGGSLLLSGSPSRRCCRRGRRPNRYTLLFSRYFCDSRIPSCLTSDLVKDAQCKA